MSSASTTPAYADIIIVIFLALVLIALCALLLHLSRKWTSVLKKRISVAKERRRLKQDKFRDENGYSWDYVITFKVYDEDEVVTENQQKFSMKYILAHLAQGGIETRLSYSVQHTLVFCKLRAPIARLLLEVDRIDYTLPADAVELEKVCSAGRKDFWGPLQIPLEDVTKQTSLGAYEYVYMKYNYLTPEAREELVATDEGKLFLEWHGVVDKLYKRWPSSVSRMETTEDNSTTINPINAASSQSIATSSCLLRGVDRLKILRSILTSRGVGGCHLDIDMLVRKQCIVTIFPLHDLLELNELELSWLNLFQFPWNQNVEGVKNYFGEKIGVYFAWLGLYTTWLYVAAAVGTLFWINVAVKENDPNAVSIPYFAGFMSIWATLFLEYWKRAEKAYALKWGMIGFEASEVERPAFEGQPSISPINGQPSLYFSEDERNKRTWKSNVTILCLLFIVVATIAFIFFIRAVIAHTPGLQGAAGIISSLLLSVQIQIMNEVYGTVAIKLNDYENHRTDTEYEDALISKTFMFQFVNSYASLFYICFVKPFIPTIDPCLKSCMAELEVSLGTIFLTRLMLGNLIELGTPFFGYLFKSGETKRILAKAKPTDPNVNHPSARKSPDSHTNGIAVRRGSSDARRSSAAINLIGVYNTSTGGNVIAPDLDADNSHRYDISEIESAFMLAEYDVMMGTFEDYAEMIIQFGYTTMFITGFPLATLMSLVNNYVEIRIDGWKLCQLCRRPEPRSQEDIGTWQIVLDAITTTAIFVNAGIVAFTGTFALNQTWAMRIWIFILLSSGLLSLKLLLQYLVPDVPNDIEIQLERHELIIDKVINNIEDDDDSDLMRGIRNIPSFIVENIDDDPL